MPWLSRGLSALHGAHLMDMPSSVGVFTILVLMISLSLNAGGVVQAQTPGPTAAPGPNTGNPDPGYPDPGYPDPGYPDPGYDEAEAYAIDGLIMCPVCPAETIGQAQVPIARQMRALVREKLSEGATRQEILDFFAERYGQDILASPPKSGLNLLAWVFPMAGVSAALVAGLLVLRSMSSRQADRADTVPEGAGPGDELDPYLAIVDQELGLGQNSPVIPRSSPGQDPSKSPADNVVEPREERRDISTGA